MTDKQRIAALEAECDQWKHWYNSKTTPSVTAPPPTAKTTNEAKFWAFVIVLAILSVAYLWQQWNQAAPAPPQRTAKVTAR